MTNAGNGPAHYDVRMSAQTRARVKDLHRQATQEGRGPQFLASFRHIAERLRRDPTTFGEPLFRLPALQLLVYQAVVLPLVVDYAVHDHRRFVFIRGFTMLGTGHG